jgi:gluconolactonase
MDSLDSILEDNEPVRLATGFVLTEGPTWHPDGFYYFSDIRTGKLYSIRPGEDAKMVRETLGGNGTTFSLDGRLVQCEPKGRRLTITERDGTVNTLIDNYQGGRLSRPNDVICGSDGSIWFTDPAMRVPYTERELPVDAAAQNLWEASGIYRLAPDGELHLFARAEYPNGLAFSPDERVLYVANSRASKYLHSFDVADDGRMRRRRIFADMNSDETEGGPDGVKVDQAGHVFCTGPGGTWVFDPDGSHIGVIRLPEIAYNFVFGGDDLRTMFFTAKTSVYTLRLRTPGIPHPWHSARMVTPQQRLET